MRGTRTRETARKPRQDSSVSKVRFFPLFVAEYESQSKEKVGPSCSTQMETCGIKLSLSLTQPSSSFLPPPLLPNKASTFGHHFCSKSRKEGIFGVVKCVSTSGTSKFQIVMAAQLIHDRVEMECLEGVSETLEGNTRCRFRGTIRFTATSLVHPDEPARTLQRTVEWILPTPTPYRLVEPVQVIKVTSSEEDPEEDPEELPPEPAVDALDFLDGDEDPLPKVDSLKEVMSASEADSTEDSGPREMATSGGSSS
ncbi:hypothetical protein GmHk_01G000942 [Glycine max]|nr:hypothetical protein GmHk_01G000942 [Glycine max]